MEICVFIPVIIILSISGPFYKLWIPNEYSNTLYILTILSCVELIIMYFSLINNSILTTFFKVKQKAIAYLISGLFNLLLVFILLTLTDLGNIAILLSAIITYIFYHLIYITRFTKKTIKTNNMDIIFLSIIDYILYIFLAILNVFIINFINVNGYIILFLAAILLFIIDVLFIILIKKINIKEFIKFLTIKNNY